MSSRLFSIIRLSRMIVPVLFAGGMVACVDDNYDLNKDISMEVGIGGKYFAIPLGTTDSIRVDSLLELDDESVFMFMEDGTAVISKLDSVKVRVPEIQQVTLQSWASEIEPIVNEIEVPEEAQGAVGEVALPEKDVNSSTSIEFDEEVPEELLDLNTVKFDGTPKLVVDIQFEAPEEVTKLELVDTIQFPKFIVFDDKDNIIDEENCLIINGEMDVDAGYRVELDIAEFNFEEEENPIQEVGSEKRLHIDGAVTLDGQLRVTVRGDGTLPGTVTVGIMPQVSIDKMKLGEITGKVNVDIEEVNEEVDLGDIPDFLKDKDVVLDIEHPVIMLEVGNTTGVPVLADLTLTPLADGSPIENGIIELRREERDIVVKAADEMGEYTWSNFFISNSEAGMELGFEFVDVPNLPNLIRQIPDVIQINMTAEADPEAEHRFDLSHGDYEMNVRYNVHVPLTFGPDLQVIYRDTIDDFNSDIKDYVKYVTEVVMEMEVENTIPLGMVCRAVALDVDGRALSGIEVSTPQPIEAAGWDGNNTTLVMSAFTIELKETVAGTMEQLDGLALEITADANEGVKGASLKNNQYLRLSGKMRIPGGITVDIDDI